MLYLLLYVRGLKVKVLIGFMFLFLLAVVVAKGPHKCRTMFCIVVAVRYLFKSVENDQLRIFPARRRRRGEGRGGEGGEEMALSPDNEKTTKSRPPFLRATYASKVVCLIRDRSTI